MAFFFAASDHLTVIFVRDVTFLFSNSLEIVSCEVVIEQNYLNIRNAAFFVFGQIFNDGQIIIEMINGNDVFEEHVVQAGHTSGCRLAGVEFDIFEILNGFIGCIAQQTIDDRFYAGFLHFK